LEHTGHSMTRSSPASGSRAVSVILVVPILSQYDLISHLQDSVKFKSDSRAHLTPLASPKAFFLGYSVHALLTRTCGLLLRWIRNEDYLPATRQATHGGARDLRGGGRDRARSSCTGVSRQPRTYRGRTNSAGEEAGGEGSLQSQCGGERVVVTVELGRPTRPAGQERGEQWHTD
jgi:hypothetical protein